MTENDRIKEVRTTKGLTLEKFGGKLGVGKTAISKIERGENSVTDHMRLSICREFNVSEEWLRTGEGEMFVKLSRNEEIAGFIGDVLSGKPDFRTRFISVLSTLTVEQWKLLEDMALKLAEEAQKEKAGQDGQP